MIEDVIMQMVHEASEAAIKKHGGIDGYSSTSSNSTVRAGASRRRGPVASGEFL